MATQKTYKGQWSSDRAEAKFRAKEAVLWARARRQPEAIDVATQFGSTRAYRWEGAGTPIVFLHGMTDTSVRWIPYAEELHGHDVYAIDIMGDVGHSTPEMGFTSAHDYAIWLGDTLDGLGVVEPHIVGASLGGYIAFSYAMRSDSVASLIGFEPVGVVKLKLFKLMRWSVRCALASFAPEAARRRLASRFRQPLLADNAAMALVLQAQRGHPIKVPPCPVFTDDQLLSIAAPICVLAGADSKAFDVTGLIDRINTIPPRGEAKLLTDAGHALSDPDLDRMTDFVRRIVQESRRPEH